MPLMSGAAGIAGSFFYSAKAIEALVWENYSSWRLLIGIIYERTHDRMIGSYTGLFSKMPIYGVFFLIITLSSMGLPVTNGFIGELLILIGAFQSTWVLALLAASGVLFGAVYLLWLFQRVFLGEFRCQVNNLKDLSPRECAVFVPLLIMIFWVGLYPKPFLRTMDTSIAYFLLKVEAKEATAGVYDKKEIIPAAKEVHQVSFDAPQEASRHQTYKQLVDIPKDLSINPDSGNLKGKEERI